MIQWIVVGLGNPGKQYARTRHNAGFMVVDALVRSLDRLPAQAGQMVRWLENKFSALTLEINNVLLMKPQTFMNDSGKAVAAAVRFYKVPLDHVVIIHDDLDIVVGQVKFGLTKGPKVHNGLESIEKQLGSKDFWRIRVGIDDRTPEDRMQIPSADYVLRSLTSEEMRVMELGIDLAASMVETMRRTK